MGPSPSLSCWPSLYQWSHEREDQQGLILLDRSSKPPCWSSARSFTYCSHCVFVELVIQHNGDLESVQKNSISCGSESWATLINRARIVVPSNSRRGIDCFFKLMKPIWPTRWNQFDRYTSAFVWWSHVNCSSVGLLRCITESVQLDRIWFGVDLELASRNIYLSQRF